MVDPRPSNVKIDPRIPVGDTIVVIASRLGAIGNLLRVGVMSVGTPLIIQNNRFERNTNSNDSPQNSCPGVGSIKPAPKAPFDPNKKISNWIQGVPAGSQSVTAPDGTTFNAPSYADFAAAYKYGQSISSIPFGLDTFGIQVAVGHGGMYDFQRSGGQSFTGAYTYASNYAVGVVLAGAGYSLDQALKIAGGFASTMSSNAGSPAQRSAWTNGWKSAHSGSCNR
jgi:hypothetical protein